MPQPIRPRIRDRNGLTFMEIMIVIATFAILGSLPNPFNNSTSATRPQIQAGSSVER